MLTEVHEHLRKKDMKNVQVNEEGSFSGLEVIIKEAVAKVSVVVKTIRATKDTIPLCSGTIERTLNGTTSPIKNSNL